MFRHSKQIKTFEEFITVSQELIRHIFQIDRSTLRNSLNEFTLKRKDRNHSLTLDFSSAPSPSEQINLLALKYYLDSISDGLQHEESITYGIDTLKNEAEFYDNCTEDRVRKYSLLMLSVDLNEIVLAL